MGAIVAALALAAVPLRLAGADLAGAYRQMAVASFGSWFALAETLTRATPLILTGLAVAVAFRARLWNRPRQRIHQRVFGVIVIAVHRSSGWYRRRRSSSESDR